VGDTIGRITTSGSITEYAIPTIDSQPFGITAGPDSAMWFAEVNGNNIGRIALSAAVPASVRSPRRASIRSDVPATSSGAQSRAR